MRFYIFAVLVMTCLSCGSGVKRQERTENVKPQKEEPQPIAPGACDLESTDYVPREFKSAYERHNQAPGALLYCKPSENAPSADTLTSIFRLDVMEHGEVDSVTWCKVRTFSFPQKTGWIKTSEFATSVVKLNSKVSLMTRAFPAPNKYYSGHAELYELYRGEVRDTLVFDKIYGGNHRLSVINTHCLDNVTALLRYESHSVEGNDSYYQDIVAYVNGKFIPLIYTDNVRENVDSADVEEYTIYLPTRIFEDEVILAPLFEHRGTLSLEEMIDKKFSFTADVSIPIDQCIVKFYEKATPRGKLKQRSTEVYHWNGADLARMYGTDNNFEERILE